tara:strand:+ start:724 stop:1404 length:681 start_codon:yes stop_codon:yes gene_type:complete
MRILLTICARGGSKGVKNKNICELAGKPLIAHTIEVAKKWGKADKIIVSTDSDQIAEVAKYYGVEIPFMRPSELSTDDVGKVSVIRHAFNECGYKYDLVMDLDVTCPIRTVKDLDNALAIFLEKKPAVLFSVVPARKNPYFNMVELKDDGFVELSKPSVVLSRQTAPEVFEINGSIYIYSKDFLSNSRNVSVTSTDKAAIYIMNENAVDIDSEVDLKFVELLMLND